MSDLRSVIERLEARGEILVPILPQDGDCIAVSQQVTDALVRQGLDAKTVTVWGWVDRAAKVLGFVHQATLVGDTIVDLTATQFDRSLPAVWVAEGSEYLRAMAEATGVQEVTLGSSRTASVPSVLYHLTDKVDFKLDPKKKPDNNTTLGGSMAPGVFLCRSVEAWVNGYGYWRPWVVEFEVPTDLDTREGVIANGYGGEIYVPAALYPQLRIARVVPLDAHCREVFGAWGWTEEDLGTTFDTFEPIKLVEVFDAKSWSDIYPWRGYRYPGDARHTDPAWRDAYKKRVKGYARRHRGAYARKLSFMGGGIPVDHVLWDDDGATGFVTEAREVLAYRGFGSWDELKDAIRNNGWRATPTFTVKGEGDTQVALRLQDVIDGSGFHRIRGTGFLGIVEFDVRGLEFATHLRPVHDPSKAIGEGFYVNPDTGAGMVYPDLGLGIGIVGKIPLDRVKMIHEVENGRVVAVWPFRDWESHIDGKKDNPDWSWRKKVKVSYPKDSGKGLVHCLNPDQTTYVCGAKKDGASRGKALIDPGDLSDRPDQVRDFWSGKTFSVSPRRVCPECFRGIDVSAGLDLEAVISVAEEAMERARVSGREISVPTGHADDPAYQAAIAPLVAWVRQISGVPSLRLYASDYMLDRSGAQAETDGMNYIRVRPNTTEMTILHEVAHVIDRSSEGQGHTPQFARTLREVYRQHLGAAAAEVFWGIVGPYVDGKVGAKVRQRAARGFSCAIPEIGREAVSIVRRMSRGAATVDDILRCATDDWKDGVGDQWGLEGSEYGPDWADQGAEDYAFVNDDTNVRQWIEGAVGGWSATDDEIWDELGDNLGEIAVVLIGETEAEYVDADWDASVGRGAKFDLIEVRYNAGWGWKKLPARGHTVTSSVPENTWFDQARLDHPDWSVIDGVIVSPDRHGQWFESKGIWLYLDSGSFGCIRGVKQVGDLYAWEVVVPVGFGPNSGRTLRGTAKTLDAAKDKAMAATKRDDEANARYEERMRTLLHREAVSSSVSVEAWVSARWETADGRQVALGWAVARDGGTPVGWLGSSESEVDRVYVLPEYRRRGIATKMLRAVEKELGVKLKPGKELSISGAPWASNSMGGSYAPTFHGEGDFRRWLDQVDRESPSRGSKTAAAQRVIYRGLRFDLPLDLDRKLKGCLDPPMDPEDIDQHLKIGPELIKWLSSNHWQGDVGLGRFWSRRKEMAETAAEQGARSGWWSVVLTATYDESAIDTSGRWSHPSFGADNSEAEVVIKAGADLTITDVQLVRGGFERNLSVLPRSIRATAASLSVEASGGDWWHWSSTGKLEGDWIHAGSRRAAQDRQQDSYWKAKGEECYFRLRLRGPNLNAPAKPVSDGMAAVIVGASRLAPQVDYWYQDLERGYLLPGSTRAEREALGVIFTEIAEKFDAGRRGAVYYTNRFEDKGSVSVVAPRDQWEVIEVIPSLPGDHPPLFPREGHSKMTVTAVGKVLYHAAPKEAREDILANGLDWRRSPRASEPPDPRNLAPVAVYFSLTKDDALDMMSDGLSETHDLYEVDVRGLSLAPDPYQPDAAVYTRDRVPADRMRIVASWAPKEIDEGTPSRFEYDTPTRNGDHWFYAREQDLYDAGMPKGQIFDDVGQAQRYVNDVLRSEGITEPCQVIFSKERRGESGAQWSRDMSRSRIILDLGHQVESFLLHELSHIVYRKKVRKGPSHASGFSAVFARLLWERMGVSLTLPALSGRMMDRNLASVG